MTSFAYLKTFSVYKNVFLATSTLLHTAPYLKGDFHSSKCYFNTEGVLEVIIFGECKGELFSDGSVSTGSRQVQLRFDQGPNCLSEWMERRGRAREAGQQHKTSCADTQF